MGDALIDMEIALVKAWGWSLRDIDGTSIESLLPFISRFNGGGGRPKIKKSCDQVGWL